VKCPICKREIQQDAPEYPFCGKRCKVIDLGNWASERYVISTPAKPEDDILDSEGVDGEGE